MKRLVTFFLICMLTAYSSVICYAGNSALTGEQEQAAFGIYATYIAGETEYLTSPIKNGNGEIQLPDGSVITVSGVTDNNLTLVVYPVTSQEAEAWEWFAACMEGKGKNISPFEIYFVDENGNRVLADGVTISLLNTWKNPAVFSLNSDGTLTALSLQIRDDQMIFRANGSYYYVLAEKAEQEIPTEPTTEPTTEPETEPTTQGTTGNTSVNNTGSGQASGAQTGDNTPLELYAALLLLGLTTVFITVFSWKKNHTTR